MKEVNNNADKTEMSRRTILSMAAGRVWLQQSMRPPAKPSPGDAPAISS
jgi:hypothetical protein